MTSLPRIARIPGISGIPGSDVIFQEVALGIPPRISCSPNTKFQNPELPEFLEIRGFLENDVIFQEVALGIPPRTSCSPNTKWKNREKIEKLDFVSGEHDMRGGIPSATSWKMTSSRIPGILVILGSDVIFQEILVSGAHSSVTPGFWNFVLGEHDMRGGIPSATSWKMTSLPGIFEIPGILAILGNDVIFQEIPVFWAHSSVNLDFRTLY
ncbi:unnamed protein product [Xylocopa violacea]|uniref:Uncharacterized protein n=1 Tax=Xylocopa violacea TaxID=135666 RepID=A0ABP1NJ51_XYLVO